MAVNLACLLPQAPLISMELMFYFLGPTTIFFFFLFASCIILLLFLKILYTRRMVVPYIKIEKEKKKTYPVHKAPLMRGLGGWSVDSPIFGEVDSWNGGALHIIEKK